MNKNIEGEFSEDLIKSLTEFKPKDYVFLEETVI